MRRFDRTLMLVALILLAACDRGGGEVTFNISADSIIAMAHDTAPGSISVVCQFALAGRVEGPEDGHITVRGGRAQYLWWENGTPISTYEWSREAAAVFWADSVLPSGELRASNSHGFGQSHPGRPVRGTVTFDYVGSDSDSVRTTNPWNFYCH